jgi:Fe-S-cluster-containing hydrogenase component 2
VAVCPQNARTMEEFPEVKEDLCNHCGACVEACPNRALAVEGSAMTTSPSAMRVLSRIFFLSTIPTAKPARS